MPSAMLFCYLAPSGAVVIISFLPNVSVPAAKFASFGSPLRRFGSPLRRFGPPLQRFGSPLRRFGSPAWVRRCPGCSKAGWCVSARPLPTSVSMASKEAGAASGCGRCVRPDLRCQKTPHEGDSLASFFGDKQTAWNRPRGTHPPKRACALFLGRYCEGKSERRTVQNLVGLYEKQEPASSPVPPVRDA